VSGPTRIASDHPAADVRLVLVHSPMVGPDTLMPLAEHLRGRACQVLIPRLSSDTAPPYWAAHVDSVVEAIGDPGPSALVLVLHSAAGQLADHLAEQLDRLGHVVAAVVYLDAGLPTNGRSRIAQLRLESPQFADELQAQLHEGALFPDWSDADLRDLVPDGARRRRLLDGVRRLPVRYWEEPIPAADPPEHHRGVLLLSDGYRFTREAAEACDWPVIDLGTQNHFLALADERKACDALLGLLDVVLDRPDGDGQTGP
jgi:hypothetical protein